MSNIKKPPIIKIEKFKKEVKTPVTQVSQLPFYPTDDDCDDDYYYNAYWDRVMGIDDACYE